jgi:hypothetical protein
METRVYNGPKNNRIDRIDAVGTSFRVQGVPNHIQKTDVFIQEELRLQRTRKTGLSPDFIFEDANGQFVDSSGDFEALANRYTYRLPTYPDDMPRAPHIGGPCPDPLVMENAPLEFRRWALNRTFDKVVWRSENCIDEYDSQVFDVTQLQPYLSHNLCTTDIARTKRSVAQEVLWRDQNDPTDSVQTGFQPPDIAAPVSYRNRVVFLHAADNDDANAFEIDDYEDGDELINVIAAVSLNNFSGVPSLHLVWNIHTHRYEGDENAVEPAGGYTALFRLNNDLFDQGGSAAASDRFWDGRYYKLTNGTRGNMAARRMLPLYVFPFGTSKLQHDGYCYYHQSFALDTGIDRFSYEFCYTLVGEEYLQTNILVGLPAWRVALGATYVDLSTPEHQGGGFPNALLGSWNDNPVHPGVGGDLGYANIPVTEMYADFLRDNQRLEKIGKVYFDTDAWVRYDENGDEVPDGNIMGVTNMIPVVDGVTQEHNVAVGKRLYKTYLTTPQDDQAGFLVTLGTTLENILILATQHDAISSGAYDYWVSTEDGNPDDRAVAWQLVLDAAATSVYDRSVEELHQEENYINQVRVQAVAKRAHLQSNALHADALMNFDLTKWRFEFEDTPLAHSLKRWWFTQNSVRLGNQIDNAWWGGLARHPMYCIVKPVGTIPVDIVVNAGQEHFGTMRPMLLRHINQYLQDGVAGIAGATGTLRRGLVFEEDTAGDRYYFQASEEGFVVNRAPTAAWLADRQAANPAHITSIAVLNTVGFAFAAQIDSTTQLLEDRTILQITNPGVHGTNITSYQAMSFDVYCRQPRAVAPVIPVGFRHDLYEPFFSFGSGTGMFPCKRPLDQQREAWPIAIQDYDIRFQRRLDRGMLKAADVMLETDDNVHGEDLARGVPVSDIVNPYIIKEGTLRLIVNSSDIGIQAEKDVSDVVQYAPHLEPYESKSYPFSQRTEGITQSLHLSRGFPSFFFIRLEWDSPGFDEGFVPRPTITAVKIRCFSQENPYMAKLTGDELYYITHKNSHKYCGFQDLWEEENAVLLSLEDVGLMSQNFGYPRRERLELELHVTWSINEALETMSRDTTLIETKKLRLRTVCIYENGKFVADIRRSEFVESYL